MSGILITSLEVLNREYSVEGGEWLIGDPDYQEPTDDDDEPGKPTLCLRGRDWQIWEGEDGWTDMDGTPPYKAFVAWGCAHLGIPTPWRAAELLTTEARERDKAAFALPFDKDRALHEGGKSTGLHAAARMLLGEPMWGKDEEGES